MMLCRASSKRRWAICARVGGRSGEAMVSGLPRCEVTEGGGM
jgi:hypothetical protein